MGYDEELAGRIRDIALGEPGLSEQKMFGGLAFLVHGHMAVAVSHRGGLLLRVPPERTEELLREPHTDEFVMRERTMAGWLRVEPAGVESEADLERWAAIGLEHARSLPPK
ncbi:TfoX/Sxy family protein [Nocardioides mangrovi]|uniref:TfoX/Sxy family protein n=1 Tax=Nocardioides mangrovi TaxID=2874580 RepID=A0ABS7UAI0_9ACTN|nr:TfoX/Sxy family protein [Nocardioides mangrovi]MBZ5737652.1 TfoX/Sxy family protein [Nocardioides mangrovi]